MATEKNNIEPEQVTNPISSNVNGKHIIEPINITSANHDEKEKKIKVNGYSENNEKKSFENKSAKKLAKVVVKDKVNKPIAGKKKSDIQKEKQNKIDISFLLKFHTNFGQSLFITGNHEIFGDGDPLKALPMQYLNEELWTASVSFDINTLQENIIYNYLLKYEDGYLSFDWGKDKILNKKILDASTVIISDAWNHAGFYENVFYTEPFKNVLLKENHFEVKSNSQKNYTHTFKIKAPLLKKGETICILGNTEELGNWQEDKVVVMNRQEAEDFYSVKLNLSKAKFPIIYKYGIFDAVVNKFLQYEGGNNRVILDAPVQGRKSIINDGFAVLADNTWKGAGVAIPVFSLRTKNSCGVGEFADLKLLVDWAKKTGLRLIQILPVNDTTATHTWLDSYPYAAISAFALHPMYLNLENVIDAGNTKLLEKITSQKIKLNKLENVDFEKVNNFKWQVLKEIYPFQKDKLFSSSKYKVFFEKNKDWLIPYAVFCFLRDENKTADFTKWHKYNSFKIEEAIHFFDPSHKNFNDVAIHLFIQFHLHEQLQEAAQYAHENGIIVKGDIPIGIYRNGADAWQHPELYHMKLQAGAPPDDFAVTGQNWSFPTYDWERMRENGFAWWKQRFEQMSNYFDAFRIDHILGFFRIWSIPMHAIEGIMGHFEPAIPLHINEFSEKHIWFDYNRYCNPFITDEILWHLFGDIQNEIKNTFLENNRYGYYTFKPEYKTQRNIEDYFANKETSEQNAVLKQKLFGLLSNVILFEVDGSNGKQFHFRFAMDSTSSFANLDWKTQQQLKALYINYFFERQDAFWMHEAMQKLPALKRVTNMLICGEDLGLVPACVPDVMKQLGILSLEIQRMPKDAKKEFFHPNDAPYLSVVTPSTHDMSTIRGWWEEDRIKTQRFYNFELGQWGDAPHFCEAWVNKAIVLQHLYSPAMWSIFQMQDLLGIDKNIRRENPHEERINVPANPKNYWKYRMHIALENLLLAEEYNSELKKNIQASGR